MRFISEEIRAAITATELGLRSVNDVRKKVGMSELKNDNVNHPSHYNQYVGFEVIDLVEQMNFNRGNAVKYLCRAGFKSPETELEDLEKAAWYLAREIQKVKDEAHREKLKRQLEDMGTVIEKKDLM